MKICPQFRHSPTQRPSVRAKAAECLLAPRWFASIDKTRKLSLNPRQWLAEAPAI